ncbi:MAG TPA: PEP-CTERM sorting domain-containing protein [Nitrospirales bacterium]|jgi:hypothetical protein|nr:PEP-CTERM sorting domain-containing protein [Nitrospirales bacterium]
MKILGGLILILVLTVTGAQADTITSATMSKQAGDQWVGLIIQTADGHGGSAGFGYMSWDSVSPGWHSGQAFYVNMVVSSYANGVSAGTDLSQLPPTDAVYLVASSLGFVFLPPTHAPTLTVLGTTEFGEITINFANGTGLSLLSVPGTLLADFERVPCLGEDVGEDCYNIVSARAEWPATRGPGHPVPEPSTGLLLGAGLAGLATWRRKKAA